MEKIFEELYIVLKAATGEMFPEVPNFARRAPRDEFVRMAMLENQASKVDQILIGFLGIEKIDERGKTAEKIAYENYLMFVKMAAILKGRLGQINAAIIAAEREEIEEIKKLKYLQKMLRCYAPALEIDIKTAYEKFKETVGQHLGHRIKAEMAKKKISIRQMADELNFAPLTIQRYTIGERTPTAETLYQIADYLNVSVDYLLGLETSDNANNQETCDNISELVAKIS